MRTKLDAEIHVGNLTSERRRLLACRVAMSQPRPRSSTGWSRKGLWTKATPSIKWSQNECKGIMPLSFFHFA